MTEPELIIGKAYVYFAITSDTLTESDFLHWLGMKPDTFRVSGIRSDNPRNCWEITTPQTDDPYLYPMIRGLMDRLIPIKDRLIAFKKEYPDLHYVLEVVLHQGDGTAGLSLDNDTLLFLAEVGAILDCDIYRA